MQLLNPKHKVVYLIVDAGFCEEIIKIIRELGATGATILNARGVGGELKTLFNIPIEIEKEIVMSVVTEKVANEIVNKLRKMKNEKHNFNCICYYMPVEKTTLINKHNN
jgi:nitrogen regulatory protein PII